MKKLLTTFAIGMLIATTAGAQDSSTAFLPTIGNVEVVINLPSPFTPVQPTGFIRFTYDSCAEMPLTAAISQREDTMTVQVELANDISDCQALPISRQYELQISSDMNPNARVVVLNPLQLTVE